MPLPRKLSSRWRLNLTVLVALIVVFTGGSWAAVQIVRDDFVDQIDDGLRESATGLTVAIEILGRDRVLDIFEQTDFRETDEAMILVEPDGNVRTIPAGTTENPEPLPDVDTSNIGELRGRSGEIFQVGSVDGETPQYRVITSPLPDGSVAIIATSMQQVEDAKDTVLRVIVIVAITIAVALMVVVAWISHHSMRPIEKMIETAQTISGGELDTRLDASSPNPDVARLANALNAMLERLQGAFADKDASEDRLRQFVADASHELRTPLAAILGYAELYQQNMSSSPEQVDHAMDRITIEGQRMQSLVEELLLLARLDQDVPVQREPVDLVELVRDAVTRAHTVDPSREVTLTIEVEGGTHVPGDEAATTAGGPAAERRVEVDGSQSELAKAIDNLLTNARIHTPPDASTAVRLAQRDHVAVIEVTDDGPGMTAADAARAFDRFFRAEPSRARPGGNGLGLSIVAAIVRTHGGTIDLRTAPHDGATFTITLPTRRGTPGDDTPADDSVALR